jgi:hypothetical protein
MASGDITCQRGVGCMRVQLWHGPVPHRGATRAVQESFSAASIQSLETAEFACRWGPRTLGQLSSN